LVAGSDEQETKINFLVRKSAVITTTSNQCGCHLKTIVWQEKNKEDKKS